MFSKLYYLISGIRYGFVWYFKGRINMYFFVIAAPKVGDVIILDYCPVLSKRGLMEETEWSSTNHLATWPHLSQIYIAGQVMGHGLPQNFTSRYSLIDSGNEYVLIAIQRHDGAYNHLNGALCIPWERQDSRAEARALYWQKLIIFPLLLSLDLATPLSPGHKSAGSTKKERANGCTVNKTINVVGNDSCDNE